MTGQAGAVLSSSPSSPSSPSSVPSPWGSPSRGVGTVLGPVRAAVTGLVELALPSACAGCATAGAPLCGACRAALLAPAAPARPDPAPVGLPLPWAVATYDGPVRAAVLAFKEHGRLSLAGPLGSALARSARAAAGRSRGSVLLVPAPSRPAAVRARGDDSTLRLARRAARALRRDGVPASVLPVLRVAPGVADQSGLGALDRMANLERALWVPGRLAPLVAGRTVLVVDDVVTTGATLAEAARALRAARARVDCAAVVAATARRRPAPAGDAGG